MAKIIIFVGEHPAEATAMPIGRAVAKKLASLGHEVRYERIHGTLPKGGALVAYRASGEPVYQGKFDFRDDRRSAQVEKAARENPDYFVFSFHNYSLKDVRSETAKERNQALKAARRHFGGLYDQKTKSIIFQHTAENKTITKLPNLFTVEIPVITTPNYRLDFPVVNHNLSKKFGYVGEHMLEGITNKISRIVSGKRMNVMMPLTWPRITKRRRIRIK